MGYNGFMDIRGKSIYAFVDAANLFYGGEKSLRWRIDYARLIKYLREKLLVTKVFYYSGVDVDQYKAEEGKDINLDHLVRYYEEEVASAKGGLSTKKDKTEDEMALFEMHLKRAKFYRDLALLGYELRIKPTKVFTSPEGTMTTKANCDVDLTFDMMRYMSQYKEAIVMSGDGDFAPIVEYLINKKKKIRILARAERTAREMRELGGENFVDFKTIRNEIEEVIEKKEKPIENKGVKQPQFKASRTVATKSLEKRSQLTNNNAIFGQKKIKVKRAIPTFRKGF